MRVAVLGRTHWLLDAAQAVHASGHELVLVVTAESRPEYRAKERDFEALARQHGASFLVNSDVNSPDTLSVLRASAADIAISINWPTLIRGEACGAFAKGILNGHAGDLPRYRGNACPNWAILNDEPYLGFCVHQMDPHRLDAGPVYVRRHLRLTSDTYIGDVYSWLDRVLPEAFAEAVSKASEPDFQPEPQDETLVRPLRCFPRRPEDGLIDWSGSAGEVHRLVRASSRPFAGAFTFLEGADKVVIWRAAPVQIEADFLAVPGQIMGRSSRGCVLVACGAGAIEVEEAEMESGQRLPAANRFRLTGPSRR